MKKAPAGINPLGALSVSTLAILNLAEVRI